MALSENFRDFQRLNFGPPKEVQLEHPGMSHRPNVLMTSLFVAQITELIIYLLEVLLKFTILKPYVNDSSYA